VHDRDIGARQQRLRDDLLHDDRRDALQQIPLGDRTGADTMPTSSRLAGCPRARATPWASVELPPSSGRSSCGWLPRSSSMPLAIARWCLAWYSNRRASKRNLWSDRVGQGSPQRLSSRSMARSSTSPSRLRRPAPSRRRPARSRTAGARRAIAPGPVPPVGRRLPTAAGGRQFDVNHLIPRRDQDHRPTRRLMGWASRRFAGSAGSVGRVSVSTGWSACCRSSSRRSRMSSVIIAPVFPVEEGARQPVDPASTTRAT
jgi:hypothetical protein